MTTHGGKRANSGRKPSGRKAYLIRMKPKTYKALVKAAKPGSVGAWLDKQFNPLQKGE